MGQPLQSGGRYLEFLPEPRARVHGGELADVTHKRHLMVVFSKATANIEGTVRLRGPITDPGREGQSAGENFSGRSFTFDVQRDIRNDDGFGNRYRAAIFGTPGPVAETGFYRMDVVITSPEWMKPTNTEGGIAGDLRYSRNVWVQYDFYYQVRHEQEEESSIDPCLVDTVRVVGVTVYQKATVIGDPIFLALPYLVQHGSNLPGLMRLMRYGSGPSRGRQTPGNDFVKHIEAWRGAIKKNHSFISQIINARAALRSIRLDPGTTRYVGSWRDEAAWLNAAGNSTETPRMNQDILDAMFEENMRIGGRDQRLTSVFPEGGDLGHPSRSGFDAGRVTSHVGNVLDVVELGVNAWKFGTNLRSSADAEQALHEALADMADDMVHSIFKDLELEAFRHVFVRRQADNDHLLFSAAMTALGWIPGLGWPFAIGNFVAGIIANRAQDRIRDFLEPRQNRELLPGGRVTLASRRYDQAFSRIGDATAKRNRKLIQFVIRAKLLYELRSLIDQFVVDMADSHPDYSANEDRRNNIYFLIHLLIRKDVWYMKWEVALANTSPISYFLSRDSSAIADSPSAGVINQYVKVHFQDYFPIDCYCGSLRQFSGWFKVDLELGIHVDWDQTGEFEIRFNNFDSHGFDNRVWAVVFRIPDVNLARFRESPSDDLDVRRDQWARNLTSMIDQVDHALATEDNFETALRGASVGLYRRNQGESVRRGSEEIPHIESGPGGCLRARIYQTLDLARYGYLILLLNNRESEGQPRGSGEILYQRYQFLVGEERLREGHAPVAGLAVWDVEADHLVKRSRRLRFR